MSISSVGGASGAGGLSQLLATMLSRIKESQSQPKTPPPTDGNASAPPAPADSNNSLTGTDSTNLSDKIIGMLVMMQAQGGGASTGGANGDPAQTAFSGIDANSDGSISQSELETSIEKAGGTAQDADAIYSALGGTDSAGISEDQFADAAKAGAPHHAHGGHGKHAHGGGMSGASSDNSATQVFDALDTNQDGEISADEWSAAFANNKDNGSDVRNASPFQQLANQSYGTNLALLNEGLSQQSAMV